MQLSQFDEMRASNGGNLPNQEQGYEAFYKDELSFIDAEEATTWLTSCMGVVRLPKFLNYSSNLLASPPLPLRPASPNSDRPGADGGGRGHRTVPQDGSEAAEKV